MYFIWGERSFACLSKATKGYAGKLDARCGIMRFCSFLLVNHDMS